MTVRRIGTILLVVVLLSIAGAALYIHRNLDEFVEAGARVYLRQYGVTSVDLSGLRVAPARTVAGGLALHGNLQGLAFSATLQSPELGYDWRGLLEGRLDSIVLQRAVIRLCPEGPAAEPGPIDLSRLLPRDALSNLPLNTIEIKHWRVDYCPQGDGSLAATGSLRLDDTLQLDATSPWQQATLRAAVAIPRQRGELALALSLDHDGARVIELQADADTERDDGWRWAVGGRLDLASLLHWLRRQPPGGPPVMALLAQDGLAAEGTAGIEGTLRHPTRLDLDAIVADPLRAPLSGQLTLALAVEGGAYPGLADRVRADVEASLDFAPGDWRLQVAPGTVAGSLAADLLVPDDAQRRWLDWGARVPAGIEWAALAATLPGDGPATVQLDGASMSLGEGASWLRAGDLELRASIDEFRGPPARLSLAAGVDSALRDQTLPRLALQLQQEAADGRSTFDLGLADDAGAAALTARGTLGAASGAGRIALAFDSPDLPALANTVLPLLDKLELPTAALELTAGTASVTSDLHTASFDPGDWRQTARLVLSGAAGAFDGIAFSGLDIVGKWRGIDRWQTVEPVLVTLRRVDAGVELTNLRARIALWEPAPPTSARLSIEELSAHLFGGSVELARPASWELGAARNGLALRARNWSLAEVVALQQSEDLEATGVLEGELPIDVADGRLVIEGGFLRALPPGGEIRYTPDDASRALTASETNMKLVTDLLRDFDYQVLSSEVALDEEGILKLQMSLAGSNAQVYAGRRIEFTINLEQDVDPLLESLRLGGELLQRIEGGVQ